MIFDPLAESGQLAEFRIWAVSFAFAKTLDGILAYYEPVFIVLPLSCLWQRAGLNSNQNCIGYSISKFRHAVLLAGLANQLVSLPGARVRYCDSHVR